MLASRLLITAGTPGHMYLDERHEKCLKERETDVRFSHKHTHERPNTHNNEFFLSDSCERSSLEQQH